MGTESHRAGKRMAQEMPAELNYVENQSAMDSIKEAGMKYYRFSATLDRRKSATCREHDGHVYPIDEYQPGSTAPPLHPNCRSTIAGSLYGPDKTKAGTRAARNDAGKTVYIPADMKYEDWKAVYVNKSKTLEEWQEVKKNAIIKEKLTKVLVTAGIKFEIVHYPPKPIVSADLAFDDTHINQERQNGVTLPVAQDIIDTALFSLTGWKGRSERYYAMLGAVYVLDGCIRTAFLENEFDDKIKEVLRKWKAIKSDAP